MKVAGVMVAVVTVLVDTGMPLVDVTTVVVVVMLVVAGADLPKKTTLVVSPILVLVPMVQPVRPRRIETKPKATMAAQIINTILFFMISLSKGWLVELVLVATRC